MQPGLNEAWRKAPYTILLKVKDVKLAEPSTTGGTHRCEATGTVEKVQRTLGAWFRFSAGAPAVGEPLTVSVRCWPCATRDEPPGPRRIYYEAGHQPRRLVVFGDVVDGRFVAHDFEEFSG